MGNENAAGPLHPSLVELYPRELSAQWLSELLPLPAGVYGVRVLPGPHWLCSGFGEINEGSFGVVRQATRGELQEWAVVARRPGGQHFSCPHCTLASRRHNLGGWHPMRSAVVEWQAHIAETYYYKAGDEGEYDLYFHPGDLGLPGAGFGARSLTHLAACFEQEYEALCGDPEGGRAIGSCEVHTQADPAAIALYFGTSMQEVGEDIFMRLKADAHVPRSLGRRVARQHPVWNPPRTCARASSSSEA